MNADGIRLSPGVSVLSHDTSAARVEYMALAQFSRATWNLTEHARISIVQLRENLPTHCFARAAISKFQF